VMFTFNSFDIVLTPFLINILYINCAYLTDRTVNCNFDKLPHCFAASASQNPNYFGSAFICCHGQSPPFASACDKNKGQIGKVISYLKNSFMNLLGNKKDRSTR